MKKMQDMGRQLGGGDIRVVDLFAGLGGNSEGARMAGARVVWAANHWPLAVEFHAANHPETLHACQDLHQADWSTVPDHDILLASPACQGHSRARGKERAHHDSQRSTAWAVVSCVEHHRPPAAVVENVPAFMEWALYPAWLDAMHRLGYAVQPHMVDSADHGVPQQRPRLFLVCTRSAAPLTLDLPKHPHVAVDTVLEWGAGNWAQVDRPGRSPATLARVAKGRAVYGERFVMPYYGNARGGRSIQRPIGTLTTRARWALVDGPRMRMLNVNEARACMGFGAHYVLPQNVKQANFMLGNAVTPQVPADIIRALRAQA